MALEEARSFRKGLMRIFLLVALFCFGIIAPAQAVMRSGSYTPKYPRPEGLAGCPCYWQIKYDLDKQSARYTYDLQNHVKDLTRQVFVELNEEGLALVRSERDRCRRDQSDSYDRDIVRESEAAIVGLAERLAAEGKATLTCGTSESPRSYCACPVPAVKLGN